MTDLVLHQFPGAYGMESLSPFCTKLASYLQLAGVPHERRLGDPREAPRGKLPYVRWDGALLGDSQLIIERCQTELGDPLDGRLDAEAKALGHLLRRAAEDHLYWALLAMRWGDDDVWRASYRDAIAGALPKGTGWFLPGLIRRGVVKSLHHQGLGRHSRETVDAQGVADLDAIAAAMRGDFLLGDAPTSFDCSVWAMVEHLRVTPSERPLVLHARAHPVLGPWCERMRAATSTTTTRGGRLTP